MKAITIQNPWAGLIVAGVKRVENRSWPTRFRGELAIHAGKGRGWMKAAPAWVRELPAAGEPVFGAVIGTVKVVDCLRLDEYRARYGEDPFASGPWCHVYEDPKPLAEPVACRGGLSLWSWDGAAK